MGGSGGGVCEKEEDFDRMAQWALDQSPTNQILDPDLPCLAEDPQFYTFDVEAAQAALAASEYGSVNKEAT